jgi:hypothetical protein
MVINFEEITHELTSDEEFKIVPIIVNRFKSTQGKEKIVTNKKMIDGIQKVCGFKTTEPRIRKMIQFIRDKNLLNDLEIIATSQGYYSTDDNNEIITWIKSMRNKINAMTKTADEVEYRLMKKQ